LSLPLQKVDLPFIAPQGKNSGAVPDYLAD